MTSTSRWKFSTLWVLVVVGGVACVGLVAAHSMRLLAQTRTATASNASRPLTGMGTLSGTVEAPGAFKAAQVYIRNVDKRILYMVYTNCLNIVQSMIAQGRIGFWTGLLLPHAIAALLVFMLFRHQLSITGLFARAPRAAAPATPAA